MIELAEIVNASPELLEAMKNPAVKKILRGLFSACFSARERGRT